MERRMTSKNKNLRIARELREKILSGEYSVGSKLEPLSVLTKKFSTTVVTLSRAFGILENEGLVERVNGLGIFVKGQAKHRFAVIFDSNAEMGFFARKAVFMKYFIEYCRANGYEYNVFQNIDTDRDCDSVRKYLLENSCDAVLVSSRTFAAGAAGYLHVIPVAAIGLYPYKYMETTLCADITWINDAFRFLRKNGCRKIALITAKDDSHLWKNPSLPEAKGIYRDLCTEYSEICERDFFCQVELSPRGGYSAGCALLDKMTAGEKIGLIVTDSVLSNGVISAALQKQFIIGKNLLIVSQALSGFSLSLFSIPVISCQMSVSRDIDLIDSLIKDYSRSGVLKKGCFKSSWELVIPEDDLLTEEPKSKVPVKRKKRV